MRMNCGHCWIWFHVGYYLQLCARNRECNDQFSEVFWCSCYAIWYIHCCQTSLGSWHWQFLTTRSYQIFSNYNGLNYWSMNGQWILMFPLVTAAVFSVKYTVNDITRTINFRAVDESNRFRFEMGARNNEDEQINSQTKTRGNKFRRTNYCSITDSPLM